ncbi:AI-2E family transporter [Pontibacter diazotrophicus]|uniref:AI-2E family transporter n=2 Tax=Pontibacter diazotrophicus TaxID=1400979 RepID=A0A3D8L3S8_9BACT|nr:AI-2E family transporter [Pontibacter diazotrophicus]
MKDKLKRFLLILFLVIGTFYLFFHGLALAKGVLAPLFLAVILAMMLAPVSNWLEGKGVKRGWAALLSDLVFFLFVVGVFWAVGMEVQKLTSQWPSIQDRLSDKFGQVESFVEENSGFSLDNPFSQGSPQGEGEQASRGGENRGSSQQTSGDGKAQQASDSGGGSSGISVKSILTTVASRLFGSLSAILLITVYIFFMLLYRRRFYQAVLKFVPGDKQEEGKQVLSEIVKDARQYLVGNLILVAALSVIYAIGFSVSGMGSPFTTAFLVGVLSLVPYVGNIVGGAIALAIAFATTGDLNAVWIVLGTIAVAQFVESYLIEPYLVGNRIKVNPLFTIIAVVVGSAVWGIIGMIVFLPLFSFIKAVADHVPMLKPLGYTIGSEGAKE